MSRVFDLFPVCDEERMVLSRVRELASVPDVTHVGVEGVTDFRGRPRMRHMVRERLPEGLGRCRFYVAELPTASGPWAAERWQRDVGLDVIEQELSPSPDDLVLSCDVDEIVRGTAIPAILTATEAGPVKLAMRMHCYSERWLDPNRWVHPAAFRWRDRPVSLDDLRRDFSRPVVGNAGWHLTWFMAPERAHEKLRSFSHTEFDTDEAHGRLDLSIEQGVTMHGYQLLPWDGSDMPAGW